jgi:hypothetical protein
MLPLLEHRSSAKTIQSDNLLHVADTIAAVKAGVIHLCQRHVLVLRIVLRTEQLVQFNVASSAKACVVAVMCRPTFDEVSSEHCSVRAEHTDLLLLM